MFVPYLLWGPLTDLRQTWWHYVGGPPNCPWGVLFQKGQRATFTFHYIICTRLTPHTLQKAPFALLLLHLRVEFEQKAPFAALHLDGWWVYVGGPRNCPWGVLFRKGQQVDGSTCHFFGHYIIYDSRRHHAEQSETTPLQKPHSVFCPSDG